MKKSNLTGLIAAGVAVAVQTEASRALADTETFTNLTAQSSSSSFTMPISPNILNADELIGISDGTASGGEFATFTLTADYANSTQDIIYQTSGGMSGITVALDSITDESFPTGNIDGLTFSISASPGGGSVTVPAGTVFTFAVPAPEPTTMALFGLGSAGLWLAARRRAQR